MTDFLIKSTLSLIVLISVYFLILENEKMAVFNRIYLLFSIFFSFSLPFITIEVLADASNALLQETVFKPENVIIAVADDAVNYFEIVFWTLYGIGTIFFLFRFIKNINSITSRIKRNSIVKYKNAKLVLLEEKILPHTFLNTIFIYKSDFDNRNIEEELYTHELTHVTQKHTLDILFVEIIKCIFWFNPIFIIYKKAIQLNHEFLADEKVVNSYNNIPVYQSLLLSKANEKQPYYLASNLNYLVTKKRLIMMSKKTPISIAILKKVALTPIFAGLIYFMCVESIAQEKNSLNEISNKPIESYFSGVRFIYREGVQKELKINKLYEDLTDFEKNKFKLFLKFVNGNPLEKKSPTKKELEGFKDSKKYAIWINDVHVPNKYLNNYNTNDIAAFGGSVVLKNARSKKIPQPFQYWFFTQKYYDDKNMGEQAKKYSNDTIEIWHKKINKKGSNKIKTGEVSNRNKNDDNKNELVDTTQPSFPGGMGMFFKYVGNNFKIPENFKGSGKIYLKFIVEKDGSITDIEIIRDLGFGLGDEAVRVLKESPKWIPGQLNGKPARMMYSLPITIISNL
jgi:hypothetical protein